MEAVAAHAREVLAGRVIWNISATETGGGVAEMLHTLHERAVSEPRRHAAGVNLLAGRAIAIDWSGRVLRGQREGQHDRRGGYGRRTRAKPMRESAQSRPCRAGPVPPSVWAEP